MSNEFESLGLTAKSLRGIKDVGYETPTPIQSRAIPILMAGEDLIAQAQTGTGKTAAFALPILENLKPGNDAPQALILCPTRELAMQVSEAIHTLGRGNTLRIVPVYGGQPIERQLRGLRLGAAIVVGTPGRVLDHLRRKTLNLSKVSMVVLDEADEMLAMGFIDDIRTVFDALPEERQIALFSATMPGPIRSLANKYLRNAKTVTIESKPHTIPQIRQSYYEVPSAQKMNALCRILDMETPGPTIIFCRTKRECDELGEHLRGRGYQADTLHGDLKQAERDRVMRRFRQGQADLLVATDVAARGLDVETVTHVINYNIPFDAESYTHRIGRTGRAGREGDAITLVAARELRLLKSIEKGTGARIRPVRLPTTADVAVRRLDIFKKSIIAALKEGALEQFLITVDELTEEHGPSEVAAAALKLLWAQQKSEISVAPVKQSDGPAPELGSTRLFLTAGRKDGLRPADLVGAIANEAQISGNEINAIDIQDDCSFVEVPTEKVEQVIRALKNTRIRGVRLRAERTDGLAQPASNKAQPASHKPASTRNNRREPASPFKRKRR